MITSYSKERSFVSTQGGAIALESSTEGTTEFNLGQAHACVSNSFNQPKADLLPTLKPPVANPNLPFTKPSPNPTILPTLPHTTEVLGSTLGCFVTVGGGPGCSSKAPRLSRPVEGYRGLS